MRQQKRELGRLGVQVAVVTFQGGRFVETYIRETGFGWPILIDDALRLYRAYGMGRGRLWDVLGPSAWWVYVKLMFRGRRPRLPNGRFDQLGGDVLIDPDGIVRLRYVGRGPADRPAPEAILDIVRESPKTGPTNRTAV